MQYKKPRPPVELPETLGLPKEHDIYAKTTIRVALLTVKYHNLSSIAKEYTWYLKRIKCLIYSYIYKLLYTEHYAFRILQDKFYFFLTRVMISDRKSLLCLHPIDSICRK